MSDFCASDENGWPKLLWPCQTIMLQQRREPPKLKDRLMLYMEQQEEQKMHGSVREWIKLTLFCINNN